MDYRIDEELLTSARGALGARTGLRWILGGSGAGKSTVCRALGAHIEVLDMDARIYGAYHQRFDPTRHPASYAWTSSKSSLGFLLGMSWEEFDVFHRASLVEILDLLADELPPDDRAVLIDGGVWHVGTLARAIPAERLLLLSAPEETSRRVWEENEERRAMKGYLAGLPDPEAAWARFLEFDERMSATSLREAEAAGVSVLVRSRGESPEAVAAAAGRLLGIAQSL